MSRVPAPDSDRFATLAVVPAFSVDDPPPNSNVPPPVIAPAKLFDGPANDSVPEATVTVPVSAKLAAIVLVSVPPVFSNSPALVMWEAVEVPCPIPLLSVMS